ncbi:MAG: GNAT family N-acetyltransferase [Shimia sp.]|uniref:GNAT family N-acetyltransferase n=1 Tax=Shimia sp. TaxID=1954381 RepID=UPI001B1F7502|nr:GNAT family N-acetyltransferase [Shimia sp.]MBO6897594.1 GNAT family N-acetyltransferase [Shimia sp.]
MIIREARAEDAAEVSAFLQALVVLGKRRLPADEDFVRDVYIGHADNIACSVAEDADGSLLGIQILLRATEGNPYCVAPGWGIIGTHVNPKAARRGVGRKLFATTRAAAETAGLQRIEATIGAQSPGALAYYDSMGFETVARDDEKVRKVFEVG